MDTPNIDHLSIKVHIIIDVVLVVSLQHCDQLKLAVLGQPTTKFAEETLKQLWWKLQ